jgi:Phasin protein
MSKRKPAKAAKHARSPKIAAKAQRANQAIVRSPAGPTESPSKSHANSKQALLVENPVTALQDDYEQTMTDSDSKKSTIFSLATANVSAYQAELMEMAQANMQFAFEFVQRLAALRSPVEFPGVIAEFTSKQIAMFRKYSKEMAEIIRGNSLRPGSPTGKVPL